MDRMTLSAELAWRSGQTRRRLRHVPAGLYVFNLHRIGDREETRFDPNVFSCGSAALAEHIQAIRRHFDIIGPSDLEDALSDSSTDRCALFTFDDGYRDNFTAALPVLLEQDVRPLFFICTSFIEDNEPPWWDQLAFFVRHRTVDEVEVNGQRLKLTGRPCDIAIREVLREFKLVTGKSAEKLASLEAALKPSQEVPREGLFMTWDDVREAKRMGVSIGSHSISHDKMSHLSIDEQRSELADSKRILDKELEQDTKHLAYPVGGYDSFTQETKELALREGYRYAFTTEQHSNAPSSSDCLSLGRFSISTDRPSVALQQMLHRLR